MPLAEQLNTLRAQISKIETELLQSYKDQSAAQAQVGKIQELLRLQKQEEVMGRKRLGELEKFLKDLQARRVTLEERIQTHKLRMRQFLMQLSESESRTPLSLDASEEALEAPKRELLSRLVSLNLRKTEELRADLSDAQELDARIQVEKDHIAAFMAELHEREQVLKFHKQLQANVFRDRFQARLTQLESYRELKSAEGEVETLMSRFNLRKEFDRIAQEEAQIARNIFAGDFAQKKGALALPIKGKVVSTFGKQFDPKSSLWVFKKGIEILPQVTAGDVAAVKTVYSGKVVFAGPLPGYGNVVIVDHGKNYFSLVAQLGKIHLAVGDLVRDGDVVGTTSVAQTTGEALPVYFEIRSGNVAVNPLKWVSL